MKTRIYGFKKPIKSYCFALTITILISFFSLKAQEKENFRTELTTDMVSQNIWRGCYQAGASIQPSLTVGYRNVELYVWGTTDFLSTQREIDIAINYMFRRFTLGITDYWGGNNANKYARNHQFEGNLKYEFNKIPFSLEWNTLFGGEDKPYTFSSYAEIGYTLELPSSDFNFSLGFTPWENQVLETDRFAITHLSVTANMPVRFPTGITLFPSSVLLYNPVNDQFFFVAKIGFSIFKF
jgi:hypothetical protein